MEEFEKSHTPLLIKHNSNFNQQLSITLPAEEKLSSIMFSAENIELTSRKYRREISEPKQKQCTGAPAAMTT